MKIIIKLLIAEYNTAQIYTYRKVHCHHNIHVVRITQFEKKKEKGTLGLKCENLT